MAGKQTRPRVDQQFRAEAIRLLAEHPERTKSSIARELGVDTKTLNAWLNAEKKRSEPAIADESNVSAELARAPRELKVVAQERVIINSAFSILGATPTKDWDI